MKTTNLIGALLLATSLCTAAAYAQAAPTPTPTQTSQNPCVGEPNGYVPPGTTGGACENGMLTPVSSIPTTPLPKPTTVTCSCACSDDFTGNSITEYVTKPDSPTVDVCSATDGLICSYPDSISAHYVGCVAIGS